MGRMVTDDELCAAIMADPFHQAMAQAERDNTIAAALVQSANAPKPIARATFRPGKLGPSK